MDKAVSKWKNKPHGLRLQAKAIAFIAEKLDMVDFFADGMGNEGVEVTLTDIINQCHREHTTDVSTSTLRRWWKVYEEWGELPHAVKIRQKNMRKRYGIMSKGAKLNDEELYMLREIVLDHPNYYLDEIALALLIKCGKFLHYSTLQRYITTNLNFTLQSIIASAKQQCEAEQHMFLESLGLLLQGDASRLITIDETHKDRSASRRRKGWAYRNSGGATVKE